MQNLYYLTSEYVPGDPKECGGEICIHCKFSSIQTPKCSIGRISGETLETLKKFSRRGMNSSGKACQPLIAEASSRTGLSEQQVKVSAVDKYTSDGYLLCTCIDKSLLHIIQYLITSTQVRT